MRGTETAGGREDSLVLSHPEEDRIIATLWAGSLEGGRDGRGA